MAETLGSLCDKLTIVKLKQWHSVDEERLASLDRQAADLRDEIESLLAGAISGEIPLRKLTFAANKVYKQSGNEIADVSGSIGEIFAQLAAVNCELWHEQEKVYEFEAVAPAEKDKVVKALAHLNLKRNKCIDAIDRTLAAALSTRQLVEN